LSVAEGAIIVYAVYKMLDWRKKRKVNIYEVVRSKERELQPYYNNVYTIEARKLGFIAMYGHCSLA
jgi:hypothetical protein